MESRYSTVQLDSGEKIMLSVTQQGITIFKMRFLGFLPGEKIAEWLPNDLDRFVAKFGGDSNGSPFRYAVESLMSFASILEIKRYLMTP